MTFNLWTFLLQLINFLALAYVLHRLLYRPLHEAIDSRRVMYERTQFDAERARDEARLLQQQLQAELNDLEQQRQKAILQAHEQTIAERKKILDEAEQAIRLKRDALSAAAERERQDSLRELQDEIVIQAVALSSRLLSEAVDTNLNEQLARCLLSAIAKASKENRESWSQNVELQDEIVLESADELSAEIVSQIEEVVSQALGRPVVLTLLKQPALIGGVRLRIGGREWDASIAGQFANITHDPVVVRI